MVLVFLVSFMIKAKEIVLQVKRNLLQIKVLKLLKSVLVRKLMFGPAPAMEGVWIDGKGIIGSPQR